MKILFGLLLVFIVCNFSYGKNLVLNSYFLFFYWKSLNKWINVNVVLGKIPKLAQNKIVIMILFAFKIFFILYIQTGIHPYYWSNFHLFFQVCTKSLISAGRNTKNITKGFGL